MQHGTVLIIMRLDFLMVSYYSYFLHFGFLHCSMCKTWKKVMEPSFLYCNEIYLCLVGKYKS